MENFPFLFFVHIAPGAQLWFWLCLCVGCPQASVSHPDRKRLKLRMITALLLTQAREREGYSSHNWNARGAFGSRDQHDFATS